MSHEYSLAQNLKLQIIHEHRTDMEILWEKMTMNYCLQAIKRIH